MCVSVCVWDIIAAHLVIHVSVYVCMCMHACMCTCLFICMYIRTCRAGGVATNCRLGSCYVLICVGGRWCLGGRWDVLWMACPFSLNT